VGEQRRRSAPGPLAAGAAVVLLGAMIVLMVKVRMPSLVTLGVAAALVAAMAVWSFATGARRTALAGLALASAIAGLFAGEALLAVLRKPWIKDSFTVPLAEPDSILGTMTRAGIATRNRRSPQLLNYRQEWDVVYRTEDDGARVVPGRPVDGPVVALFGDSFLFGEGLEDSETVGARLQARLPATRVYNYGVRGHGTAQNWLLLRRVLARRPDVRMCVVTFIVDDMRRTAAPPSLLASDWARDLPRVRASGDSVVWVGRAYDVLPWPVRLHVDALIVSRLYRRFFGGWTATAADWELEAEVVAAMRRDCEAAGTGRGFLLVLLPGGVDETDVAPYRADFAEWKRSLLARRIRVLDLNGPFDSVLATTGAARSGFFYHDSHPRADWANRVAGWTADSVQAMLNRAALAAVPGSHQ
jgi:hypothetical protein